MPFRLRQSISDAVITPANAHIYAPIRRTSSRCASFGSFLAISISKPNLYRMPSCEIRNETSYHEVRMQRIVQHFHTIYDDTYRVVEILSQHILFTIFHVHISRIAECSIGCIPLVTSTIHRIGKCVCSGICVIGITHQHARNICPSCRIHNGRRKIFVHIKLRLDKTALPTAWRISNMTHPCASGKSSVTNHRTMVRNRYRHQ